MTVSPTRVRLTRFAAVVVIGLAWLVFAYASVVYVGGALVSVAAGALVLVPRGMLWLLSAYQEGMDGWAIAGRIATSLAGALAAPQVTFYLIALELVGAAALYGLQRLLRNEVRSRTFEEKDT
jgi:hypothetical protein